MAEGRRALTISPYCKHCRRFLDLGVPTYLAQVWGLLQAKKDLDERHETTVAIQRIMCK